MRNFYRNVSTSPQWKGPNRRVVYEEIKKQVFRHRDEEFRNYLMPILDDIKEFFFWASAMTSSARL